MSSNTFQFTIYLSQNPVNNVAIAAFPVWESLGRLFAGFFFLAQLRHWIPKGHVLGIARVDPVAMSNKRCADITTFPRHVTEPLFPEILPPATTCALRVSPFHGERISLMDHMLSGPRGGSYSLERWGIVGVNIFVTKSSHKHNNSHHTSQGLPEDIYE